MININPIPLTGAWQAGYALDRHVITSVYLGLDAAGHDVFENTRSEAGELLYRLKYRGDQSVVPELVAALVKFVAETWQLADKVQAIVPAPASTIRPVQPLLLLARGLSQSLGIPLWDVAVKKAPSARPIKDVRDYEARRALLRDAFVIDSKLTEGRTLLVFDDLFQSGATLNTLTEALYKQGKAAAVFVLAVTKTRS